MKHRHLSQHAPGIALIALAPLQPWLEQRMALHMAVELPLLFAIGWWMGRGPAPRWLEAINRQGLVGLAAAMIVSALWMLPVALDEAVLRPGVGLAKVASVLAAGYLARVSLRVASKAVQAFFVLNWAWMTGVAGALYQQAPEQLCSTYVQGDQASAGLALVVLAGVTTAVWMFSAFRDSSPPDSPRLESTLQ